MIIYIHGPCKIISMLKGNNLIPWYGIGKKNVGCKVVKITVVNITGVKEFGRMTTNYSYKIYPVIHFATNGFMNLIP